MKSLQNPVTIIAILIRFINTLLTFFTQLAWDPTFSAFSPGAYAAASTMEGAGLLEKSSWHYWSV